MSNILFIAVDPEEADAFNQMCLYENRNLLYTAAMLKEHDHNVMTCNSLIRDVYFKALDSFHPDIICLPYHTDPKMVEWAKTKRPDALIAFGVGGYTVHDSAISRMKSENYIDFILVGKEPFNAWLHLLDSLEAGQGFEDIKGIVYRQGEEIKENGGSYEFDVNDFKTSDPDYKMNPAVITTSIGCIGKCTFCSEQFSYKGWKGRRLGDIMKEIRKFTDNGVHQITFADAEIEAPDKKLKRLEGLCRGIIDFRKPIYYKANFRPDFSRKATPEIMDLLLESGLYSVFIGVESGCQDDLDLFRKQCTVQEARRTVRLFGEYGIYTEIGFIMFQPFSTLESVAHNVDLLEDMGMAGFNEIASYYRFCEGSKLAEQTREAGMYDKNDENWLFQDWSTGTLFTFMNTYLQTLKPAIKRYQAAAGRLWEYYYYMHYNRRKSWTKAYYQEAEVIRRIEVVTQAMSINLCNWARKLIEIARDGFDNSKAVDISIQLLNEGIINGAADYIERINKETDNLKEIAAEMKNKDASV